MMCLSVGLLKSSIFGVCWVFECVPLYVGLFCCFFQIAGLPSHCDTCCLLLISSDGPQTSKPCAELSLSSFHPSSSGCIVPGDLPVGSLIILLPVGCFCWSSLVDLLVVLALPCFNMSVLVLFHLLHLCINIFSVKDASFIFQFTREFFFLYQSIFEILQ